MITEAPQIPSYPKLLWMLLMQPIQLYQLLKSCGIENPNAPLWQLLESPLPLPVFYRHYVRRRLCRKNGSMVR